MANRYSKVNVQNRTGKDAQQSAPQNEDKKQKRFDNGARIMAILVIVAMVVTTFLAAGVFILD